MAAFGQFAFTGGAAILCVGVGVTWLLVSPGSRSARYFLALIGVVFWTAGAYAVPASITRLLSSGFRPLSRQDVPPGSTAVVLLSSGSYQERDWTGGRFAVVDRIGLSRVLEAARVFHLIDPDLLISSGGLPLRSDRYAPSGTTMAAALADLGVPSDKIVVEDESLDTHQEAVIVKRLLMERPVDHIVLVTSLVHMRRARGAFRAEGLEVIPAVARRLIPIDTWWGRLIPTDNGLEETRLVTHELAGIAVYRARGWYR